MTDVARFYDDLSAYYHLLFADWDATVDRQGAIVDALIRRLAGPGTKRVLDAACGIGTQAIGLARAGHRVHGTDLSPGAVRRAQREAARLGARVGFGVADLRMLSGYVSGPFDVVIALDNALPHLEPGPELDGALSEVRGVLAGDGLLLASVRDYDVGASADTAAGSLRVFNVRDGRRVVFQVWDWRHDRRGYQVHQYIVADDATRGVETMVFTTDYWAIGRDRLTRALADAGFEAVSWIEPTESGFYQPLVAARVAATS